MEGCKGWRRDAPDARDPPDAWVPGGMQGAGCSGPLPTPDARVSCRVVVPHPGQPCPPLVTPGQRGPGPRAAAGGGGSVVAGAGAAPGEHPRERLRHPVPRHHRGPRPRLPARHRTHRGTPTGPPPLLHHGTPLGIIPDAPSIGMPMGSTLGPPRGTQLGTPPPIGTPMGSPLGPPHRTPPPPIGLPPRDSTWDPPWDSQGTPAGPLPLDPHIGSIGACKRLCRGSVGQRGAHRRPYRVSTRPYRVRRCQ